MPYCIRQILQILQIFFVSLSVLFFLLLFMISLPLQIIKFLLIIKQNKENFAPLI